MKKETLTAQPPLVTKKSTMKEWDDVSDEDYDEEQQVQKQGEDLGKDEKDYNHDTIGG